MRRLEPRLDILPPAQRRLWDELGEVPGHFVLYGGTAIALYLGHRQSVAFDYVDKGAALIEHGIGLPMAFSAAAAIYGRVFNPQVTLKALTYFGDGDLASLPSALRHQLQDAARDVDLDRLPALEAGS